VTDSAAAAAWACGETFVIEGGLIDLANHAEWLDAQHAKVLPFDHPA
jgi:hypothetical protein